MEQNDVLLLDALEQLAAFGTVPQGAAHLIDVGTTDYIKYFREEVIEGLIAKGGATCRFFEGAYGSGKTHTLQMIREVSFNCGMAVASTDLSQALSLSDWRLITEYILQNIEVQIDGEIVTSLPEILAALGEKETTKKNIDILKKQNLPCPGFKNAIIHATRRYNKDSFSWEVLKQYLLGRKISVALLRNKGFNNIKGNLTQRNAEYVLKTVLASLYYLGCTGTTLLFDENERTLTNYSRKPSNRNRIAANLIRRMIDGCANGLMTGTVVVFAVLPGFLENCALNYQALGQRLQIVRGGYRRPSWRWPVLPVDAINSAKGPEEFLEQAAYSFLKIIERLGGNTENLYNQLNENGQMVLERNVGSGYKRELIKTLASISLERL